MHGTAFNVNGLSDPMKILVSGGAGYIGSHMVKTQCRKGCGEWGAFVHADLADRGLLSQVLGEGRFDAVMHFAASIEVEESVRSPAAFYLNNVSHTLHLLEAMKEAGVHRFVFSSTAATFGQPQYLPIDERHPQIPINPCGRSKWMVE